jgi:iron-sulfur cluster repair protein YtfE (RIC family)
METTQKSTHLNPDTTLEQLITVDENIAELLASIGLNASQHQDKTLRQICTEKQWNEEEVVSWIRKNQYLDSVQSENRRDADEELLKNKNLAELSDFLEDEYHVIIKELLSDIDRDFPRVCKIHGHQYPWLKQVHWQINSFFDDVMLYLQYEREKLFSYVRQLHQKESQVMDGLAQGLKHSLDVLSHDHKRLSDSMRSVEKSSKHFYVPEGSCATLRIVFQNIRELFDVLQRHFETEKKYLIPSLKQKLDSV